MPNPTKPHPIDFSEVVRRVKKFRAKHCECSSDEEIPLGFLAEMSHALGYDTCFQLIETTDEEIISPIKQLERMKTALGNLYRFIENDGRIVSDSNMEFLKSLMDK
jgi:hypothetical protein